MSTSSKSPSSRNNEQNARDSNKKQILDALNSLNDSVDINQEKFTVEELSEAIEKEIYEVTGKSTREKFYREKTRKIINRIRGNINFYVRTALRTGCVKVYDLCRYTDKQLEDDNLFKVDASDKINKNLKNKSQSKIPQQGKNIVFKPPKIRSATHSVIHSKENSFCSGNEEDNFLHLDKFSEKGKDIKEDKNEEKKGENKNESLKNNAFKNIITTPADTKAQTEENTPQIVNTNTSIDKPYFIEEINNDRKIENSIYSQPILKKCTLSLKTGDNIILPSHVEQDKNNPNITLNKDKFMKFKNKIYELELKYTTEKTKNEVIEKENLRLKEELKVLKERNLQNKITEISTKETLSNKDRHIEELNFENRRLATFIQELESQLKKLKEGEELHKKIIEKKLKSLTIQNNNSLNNSRNKKIKYNDHTKDVNASNSPNQDSNIFKSSEYDNSFTQFLNQTSKLTNENIKNKIILNQMNHTNIFNNIQPIASSNQPAINTKSPANVKTAGNLKQAKTPLKKACDPINLYAGISTDKTKEDNINNV